jgi:peptide/nickel transport system permease protein
MSHTQTAIPSLPYVAETTVALLARSPRRRSTLQRFLRNRLSVVGLVLVGAVLCFCFVMPFFVPLQPTSVNLADRLLWPSWHHPMGTDAVGRDLLSRVAYGGRISLAVGIAGVMAAMVAGTAMGMVAGYFGGRVDLVLMRAVDLTMAFPSMLLAIIVTAVLGVGLPVTIIAVGLFQIPNFARLVRGLVLSFKEREFITAARAIGASDWRILWRHLLPNLAGFIVVQTSLNCAWGILSVAALSFLGFGAQPPTPELGAMVSDGRMFLRQAPYYSGFPGLIITIVVLGLNFVGDGLRDALDIKSV